MYMTYFIQNQKFITKTISIYMMLIFLCLPIWNLVSNNYELESNNAIELEEVLDFETEDSSEKETTDKHKYNNQIWYSTKKNEAKQATTLYDFKHLNTSFEVLTPPPKFL